MGCSVEETAKEVLVTSQDSLHAFVVHVEAVMRRLALQSCQHLSMVSGYI